RLARGRVRIRRPDGRHDRAAARRAHQLRASDRGDRHGVRCHRDGGGGRNFLRARRGLARRHAARRARSRGDAQRSQRRRRALIAAGGGDRPARDRVAADRLAEEEARMSGERGLLEALRAALARLGMRFLAVLLIGAVLTLASEVFLTQSNLLNVLRQAALLFLIASGLTLVILTAGL